LRDPESTTSKILHADFSGKTVNTVLIISMSFVPTTLKANYTDAATL